MLYNLLTPLTEDLGFLNLFRYITFRTAGAIITSLIISFVFGRPLINWLKKRQVRGQPIRSDGPESHIITKQGTPTMGGLLILISMSVATLLWADLSNRYIWAVLLLTLGFGAIGFADDYLKLARSSSEGLPGKIKLLGEVVIALGVCWWITEIGDPGTATGLAIPLIKDFMIQMGWFFIPFAIFVIVGSGNAVNLTDGLDGLAIVPAMIVAGCLGVISYLAGNAIFATYLQLFPVPGAGELAVFCGALVGASLGFLWFNAPPAMVFMGDTGSLSIGGALGTVAVIIKHEFVLAIIGGLFVLETISVVIQVLSFKLTGRRVFRMAPLHHHFEKKGWEEATIVIRFWIIAIVLALVGLATLKLR
ncbi:MAG: phospho-N-acetylmuramoyl-pentapeptide-transferase [Pseudomonadota bacterium]|nr:phospho-N-acetylmuramoyl-pentapeptide-transferase [Pseudomonadota bacterium]